MVKYYPSQKGYFLGSIYDHMKKNDKIWVVTGDLGFNIMDKIRDDFPDRFINVGAAEQTMIGVAIGLALQGKIPFVYTIPNFLIYRPFEWIRNYIDHEEIPVKLVGSGRDKEYDEDGYTHQCEDLRTVLNSFPNIYQFWPEDKESIPETVETMITNRKPCFLSLKRKL